MDVFGSRGSVRSCGSDRRGGRARARVVRDALGRALNARRARYRRLLTLALLVAGFWGSADPARAQAPVPAGDAANPGTNLRHELPPPKVSVITFGPGDETFSKFGHDAILLSDPRLPPQQRELVFNYGTFRFDSPWLILDFLKGKLSYWLSVSTLQQTLAVYRRANRSVAVQELSLSPEAVRALSAFLYENVKPENAYYRYDYYRDNCATRIRDVVDRFVGGRLAAASRGRAPLTYREHTRRLTVGAPLLFFGLDLAMGPLIDQPVSEWEEMFLPARVAAKLDQISDDHGAPLVRNRYLLFEAKRPPESGVAPSYRWGWLALGLSFGAALYALGRWGGRAPRIAQAFGISVFSVLAGLLGSALLVLWLLTDHDVTYWNQNVLLCPIWALAIPVLAFDFARQTPRHSRLMMKLVAASVASALLALLLLLSPLRQSTGPAVSFFLPVWLGLGLGVWERQGRPALGFLPGAVRGRADPPPVV
jgi:hypothetical protein